MKNTFKLLTLSIATIGLAACSSIPDNPEAAAPYSGPRTATHQHSVMAPPVAPAPAPAPVAAAPACACDCNALMSRINGLEGELAECRESKTRVNSALRDELKK